MENEDFANTSGSSAESSDPRVKSNSGLSVPNLKLNSGDAPGKVGIKNRAQMPTLIDVLLSELQSQLGEISDASSEGVSVRIFQRDDGLAILLGGVLLCPAHHIIHSAEGCPVCAMPPPAEVASPPQRTVKAKMGKRYTRPAFQIGEDD